MSSFQCDGSLWVSDARASQIVGVRPVVARDGTLLAETVYTEPHRVWAYDGAGTVLATRWPWETQEQSTVRLEVELSGQTRE